jgi:hypothetical protein
MVGIPLEKESTFARLKTLHFQGIKDQTFGYLQ